MKNRIDIAIIALIGILISCFFIVGCTPGSTYIAVDPRSELMQPTFCLYAGRYFQEPLEIETIIVEKVQRSDEKEKQWELDSGAVFRPQGHYPLVEITSEIVWHLQYKSSNLLHYWMNCLFGWRSKPPPVRCLTYGEVPSGYQEIVKAVPLDPERLYFVWIDAHDSIRQSEYLLRFVIRLDERGIPERLEYIQREYIFDDTSYYLRLY